MFPDDALTDDAFLGGRLQLWQPRRGYRAATDPVLLAACCPARPGQSVLDLGCGAGAASLCLAARVPGLLHSGLELQPAYADLARRNAQRAAVALTVVEGSVLDMPKALRHDFDHVITNPPYYPPASTPAVDQGRNLALHEEVSIVDWIATAKRRVNPLGWLTLIVRADRMADAIIGLGSSMGSITILPFAAREGREAGRVVIRARKGGRAGLRLLAPLVLHDGASHPGDRDNHSPQAEAVFRYGEGLDHLFT
jgi:tRNA1Val (adenine37-N6)-methyltransferase